MYVVWYLVQDAVLKRLLLWEVVKTLIFGGINLVGEWGQCAFVYRFDRLKTD